MKDRHTQWWEYFWTWLGSRHLTRTQWRVLEFLVRTEAEARFHTPRPSRLQMLLAGCDVREKLGSPDQIVAHLKDLHSMASKHLEPTVAFDAGLEERTPRTRAGARSRLSRRFPG